jgi:Flp pilus assembly protein TadG
MTSLRNAFLRMRAPRPPRGRSGTAAVEFAIIAPLLALLLAGVADLGNVLYVRFRLDSAVSAASNYVLVNAASVSSTGGANLASNAATIVQASQGSSWADAAVVVNNGPTATVTNGAITVGGAAAPADSCYCPTYSAGSIAWGDAVSCGTACASGVRAGKYVTISASRTASPLFTSYGIVKNGKISASATVRTQ